MSMTTRWGAVFALIFAGVLAALQLGKAAIALPALQRELMLSLVAASWIVGGYALLGALGGLPTGIAASLFGARRTLLAALATAGLGSIAGAFVDSGAALIATRVVEGFGLLVATLAIPRLLRAVTAPKDLDTVMPLYGSYLPLGSLAMMLAGPYLLAYGWQALWLVNGALALAWALVLLCIDIEEPTVAVHPAQALLPNLRAALGTPGPILLALAFCIYTTQYMALTGLMPTLLVDRLGLSIQAAGAISAATVAANAAGNMTAGVLLRRGVQPWMLMAGSFSFLGLAGFGIFSNAAPVAVVAVLASLNLALTGLIPASILTTAPKLAPTSALLAIVLGLLTQVSNIGNVIGPTAMAVTVERLGWERAPLFFLVVAVAGIAVALGLRATLRPTST